MVFQLPSNTKINDLEALSERNPPASAFCVIVWSKRFFNPRKDVCRNCNEAYDVCCFIILRRGLNEEAYSLTHQVIYLVTCSEHGLIHLTLHFIVNIEVQMGFTIKSCLYIYIYSGSKISQRVGSCLSNAFVKALCIKNNSLHNGNTSFIIKLPSRVAWLCLTAFRNAIGLKQSD